QLEKLIHDLQAARERDQHTYSVVPYRGKHGDSRRPLYIECAQAGLVFHPEQARLDGSAPAEAVRAEVGRRIARQKGKLAGLGVNGGGSASGGAPGLPGSLSPRPSGAPGSEPSLALRASTGRGAGQSPSSPFPGVGSKPEAPARGALPQPSLALRASTGR